MIIEKEDVSIYDVESLHKELLAEFEKGDVIINMEKVNKVDMSIIQLLLSTKKSCLEASKKFEVQNINDSVLKILKSCACDFLAGENDE